MSVPDLATSYERQGRIRDGKITRRDPVQVFAQRHPESRSLDLIRRTFATGGSIDLVRKTSIPAGTSDGWSQPLSSTSRLLMLDYGLLVAAKDLLGQLAALGARRADFNVQVPVGGRGPAKAVWVGEGLPVPFGRLDIGDVKLAQAKLATGSYLTQELATATSDTAVSLVEAWLSDIVTRFTATALLDPTIAEVATVHPASLTYAAHTVASSGIDAAISADIASLFGFFEDAGTELKAPVLIMSRALATAMSWMDAAAGMPAFPDLASAGGSLRGTPVLTTAAATGQIVLVDATDLVFADEGIETNTSMEALIQPDTDPVGDAGAPTGIANPLSLWQENAVGVMISRWCWWKLGRNSVARIDGVAAPMQAVAKSRSAR
jgi:hypothetical protein